MKNRIIDLGAHISAIPKGDLQRMMGGVKKNSEIMRTIIMNEKQYGTVDYDRTLRGFWYSVVKPALDKLDRLTPEDSTDDKLTAWDKALSHYTAELVREGKLSYRDLHIVDGSRSRFVDRDTTIPYRNIAICIEKDTNYAIIRNMCGLLRSSCYSSKGLSSLGAMEDFCRCIQENSPDPVHDLFFVIMSDYDPTGFLITDTIREHAEIAANVILKMDCRIHVERIGVLPSQLTPEELENNWYTPKFKTASEREAWIARTGGEKGLELDALSLDRIREVFATSLKTYIDTSAYIDTFKSYFLYDAIDRATAPYIRNVTNAVFREKWRDVTVRDFDILDYAKAGYGDAPVNEVCHMENDDMDCLIRSTLASMV